MADEVDDLILHLKYGNDKVRADAAEALGNTSDERAVEPLIAALKNDTNSTVRGIAAWALGDREDPRAVDHLIDALKDEEWTVQYYAAEALGKIGDVRAIDPLIELLKSNNSGYEIVQLGAMGSLVSLGKPEYFDQIVLALDDDSAFIRETAVKALLWSGDTRAVGHLIEVLRYDEDLDVQITAVAALIMIDDPKAVDPLIEALKDNNWIVRCSAASALGLIGDPRAIEPLTYYAQYDDNDLVREMAVSALNWITGEDFTHLIPATEENPTEFSEEESTEFPLGSRENPLPMQKYSVTSSDGWKITVMSVIPNATSMVLNENMFNDPPKEGHQFFLAKVRACYTGQGSDRFDGSFRLRAVGASNVAYSTFENSCGVIPNPISDAEVFTGGCIEGYIGWEIRSIDAKSLVMYDSPLSFGNTERVYFQLYII
jgi:HEAT repeat protein